MDESYVTEQLIAQSETAIVCLRKWYYLCQYDEAVKMISRLLVWRG